LLNGWYGGLRLSEAMHLPWEPSDRLPGIDFEGNRVVLPADFAQGAEDQFIPCAAGNPATQLSKDGKNEGACDQDEKEERKRNHDPGEFYGDSVQQGLQPMVVGNCPQEPEAEEERPSDSPFLQQDTDHPFSPALWSGCFKDQIPDSASSERNEKQTTNPQHQSARLWTVLWYLWRHDLPFNAPSAGPG
jgi:hypothetical protein